MRSLARSRLIAVATLATGAAIVCGFAVWADPRRTLEFSALVLGALLASLFAVPRSAALQGAVMSPAFVFEFALVLLFGPQAATVVAIAAIVAQLADSDRSHPVRRLLVDVAAVLTATQTAGALLYQVFGPPGQVVWPWQALPVAAAAAAYAVIRSLFARIVAPMVGRRPVDRSWPIDVVRAVPNYFVGAGIAVALVAAIDRQLWNMLAAAAVPLFFAYRVYADYVNRLADEHRRREVMGTLAEGMCVIDGDGRVVLWNDALERILACPRERALGRPLTAAVPALAATELRRTIDQAATSRRAGTVTIGVQTPGGARILDVNIVPVADAVTMVWHDATERTHAEREVKRNEERLALAAEGANDGLWEWDLRNQEFYMSSRWRAMIGLPPSAVTDRPERWTERVHPDDVGPLKGALEAHLAGKTVHFQCEHRIRHEDGSYRWFLSRGVAAHRTGRRPARIAGSLTDTTERVNAQERLRTAGFVDPLTGLCNRTVFVEGLGRRLDDLKQRRAGGWFAVLYLDLDRFKLVNDSLGHLVGDELLVAVSRRLESCLRPGDALARLGGDEFAILLNGLDDDQQANAIASRIQQSLSAPFSIGGREVFTSASIGIAFGVAQYATPDEIMRDADTAMYHAKSRGKARHELFDADMHARARNRLGLENDLRRAINNNDFEVQYQPIVSLASGMCVGFESLVRWNRNGEPISPATFVPIAEELGLIEPLGTWVLQEACRTFAGWRRRFPTHGLECITVNASSRQLMQQNFMRLVEDAVQKSGLKPCELRIEITETALLDSPNIAAELLRELRDFGVKIYLDDFGTGYSSLSHLHKLPVDALKIDRSFVRSLLLPERPAIVESILGLARTLNTSVVAEGIESDLQAHELERLGCTHAQGFLFSRPLSAAAVEELLIAKRPLGPKCGPLSLTNELEASTPAPFAWSDRPDAASAAIQGPR